MQDEALCVEHTNGNWHYYHQNNFLIDESVGVSCFADGYLEGLLVQKSFISKKKYYFFKGKAVNQRGRDIDGGHGQKHFHQHFHYLDFEPRNLPSVDLPSYKLKGNKKYVEATFLFPQAQSNWTKAEVIEAKRK